MAQVLVRDISPELVEKLRVRARRNQRSLEAELRVILHEALQTPLPTVQDDIERVRALFAGRSFTDSAILLREDRDR